MIKSPFKVYQDFLSPKHCDAIVDRISAKGGHVDKDGRPMVMERLDQESQDIIFDRLKPMVPELEEYYGLTYKGTEKIKFQGFPEGMNGPAEKPRCFNAEYLRKKWVKVAPVDLTAVLWLSDFQDKAPLDTRYEVYGGKLEFPAYDFSLVPQRGTLIIYPAGPHFISAISPVMVGNLYQARINIGAEGQWLYQPSNFQGKYQDWFQQYV